MHLYPLSKMYIVSSTRYSCQLGGGGGTKLCVHRAIPMPIHSPLVEDLRKMCSTEEVEFSSELACLASFCLKFLHLLCHNLIEIPHKGSRIFFSGGHVKSANPLKIHTPLWKLSQNLSQGSDAQILNGTAQCYECNQSLKSILKWNMYPLLRLLLQKMTSLLNNIFFKHIGVCWWT